MSLLLLWNMGPAYFDSASGAERAEVELGFDGIRNDKERNAVVQRGREVQ